jgi:hypothetical protein
VVKFWNATEWRTAINVVYEGKGFRIPNPLIMKSNVLFLARRIYNFDYTLYAIYYSFAVPIFYRWIICGDEML